MHLSRRRFGQISLAALGAACTRSAAAPDLLIFGGPIYTGVAANPRVEAVRISGGRIAFAARRPGATGAFDGCGARGGEECVKPAADHGKLGLQGIGTRFRLQCARV